MILPVVVNVPVTDTLPIAAKVPALIFVPVTEAEETLVVPRMAAPVIVPVVVLIFPSTVTLLVAVKFVAVTLAPVTLVAFIVVILPVVPAKVVPVTLREDSEFVKLPSVPVILTAVTVLEFTVVSVAKGPDKETVALTLAPLTDVVPITLAAPTVPVVVLIFPVDVTVTPLTVDPLTLVALIILILLRSLPLKFNGPVPV